MRLNQWSTGADDFGVLAHSVRQDLEPVFLGNRVGVERGNKVIFRALQGNVFDLRAIERSGQMDQSYVVIIACGYSLNFRQVTVVEKYDLIGFFRLVQKAVETVLKCPAGL